MTNHDHARTGLKRVPPKTPSTFTMPQNSPKTQSRGLADLGLVETTRPEESMYGMAEEGENTLR